MARFYVSQLTRAALDDLRAQGLLRRDRLYFLVDEAQFCVGLQADSYTELQSQFSASSILLNGNFAAAGESWSFDYDGNVVAQPEFENGACQFYAPDGHAFVSQGFDHLIPEGLNRVRLSVDSFEGDGFIQWQFNDGLDSATPQITESGVYEFKVICGPYQNAQVYAENCIAQVDNIELYVPPWHAILAQYVRANSAANFAAVSVTAAFRVGEVNNSNQVVGARRTGWSAPSGTRSRAAFDTSTVTVAQLAQRVAALMDDLASYSGGHGLIGQ